MTYDETVVAQVRGLLSERTDVEEKPIVGGGLGFMVSGHLCCGVSSRGLLARVGAEAATEAVSQPHVEYLMFGARQAAAFVVVGPEGYQADGDLRIWVDRSLDFVATLG